MTALQLPGSVTVAVHPCYTAYTITGWLQQWSSTARRKQTPEV